MIDIFSSFLAPLEHELMSRSSYSVGKSHSISHNTNYMERIEAVNFALDNDDGARTRYDKADLILVGVSRCGKTPTCLYMAMQYGIRAANYPLTEDDMERLQLPSALKEYKDKLFGLTIDPDRLAAIRNERKPNSRYASFAQCEFEVREVENLFRRENINFINSTHFRSRKSRPRSWWRKASSVDSNNRRFATKKSAWCGLLRSRRKKNLRRTHSTWSCTSLRRNHRGPAPSLPSAPARCGS